MRNQNKKKRQDTGFTLIELLAVITIMGILMMVAIPSISNTINNSRKDTFVSTAQEIASAIKTAYNSDQITCYDGSDYKTVASYGNGEFIVAFGSTASDSNNAEVVKLDNLLDGGAKSPFGGTDLSGYVTINVTGVSATYTVAMTDTKHYINSISPKEVKRSDVMEVTNTNKFTVAPGNNASLRKYRCKYSA